MKSMAFFCIIILGTVSAQDDLVSNGITLVHEGFDAWDESKMIEGKALLERALSLRTDDPDILYWLAFANYRLAIKAFYNKQEADEEKAEKLVDQGIEYLEKANDIRPTSESLALLGSLTGLSIQFNPISGMWKGPKSNGQYADAIKRNPENPRAYYLQGIGKMNTPEMFGGGADKAIPSFIKAIEWYEKESASAETSVVVPRWGYAECCAFLGNAYLKLKDYDNARQSFEKALAINPNARLAKNGLAKIESEQVK
jgi:tetratricopeptide (TPR) repeat protein